MYQARRIATLTFVAVAVLAASACGTSDKPRSDQSSAGTASYPSGTVVVEPLKSIPGAKRIEVDGVGIDVMPGYTSVNVGNQPGQTLVQIKKEGGNLVAASLAVTRLSRPATDADLDIGFNAYHQLAPAQRGVTDIADIPLVVWDAMVHPLGLNGVEHPTTDLTLDLRWIGGRETAGNRLVSVQVWAKPGTSMEDSDGWRMARTVRFDSAGSTAPPS